MSVSILSPSRKILKRGWRSNPPTMYSRCRGRFIVSSSGLRAKFFPCGGLPPERSGLAVLVGRDHPWRAFVADLRRLADEIEFSRLVGPADQHALYLEDGDELQRPG